MDSAAMGDLVMAGFQKLGLKTDELFLSVGQRYSVMLWIAVLAGKLPGEDKRLVEAM